MFFSLSRLINNAEICDKKYIIYATRKGLSLQIEILFVIYCCTKKGSFLALTLYQGSTVLLSEFTRQLSGAGKTKKVSKSVSAAMKDALYINSLQRQQEVFFLSF